MNTKKHTNRFLSGACVVIVMGYIFFLSSNIFMTDTSSYYTPLLTTLTGNNRHYTLQEWDYSPDDGVMEIMIGIDNQAYDSINTYSYGLYDIKYGYLQGEKAVESRDLLVLRFENIKKFSSLSLRITVDTTDNSDITPEVVRFYNNSRQIHKVDKIEERKPYEYYILKLQRQIEVFEEDIKTYEELISDIQAQITSAENNIAELEKSKAYKTEKEIQVIDNQIGTVKSDISNFNYEIYQNQETIQERELQIENAYAQIQAIKEANEGK